MQWLTEGGREGDEVGICVQTVLTGVLRWKAHGYTEKAQRYSLALRCKEHLYCMGPHCFSDPLCQNLAMSYAGLCRVVFSIWLVFPQGAGQVC